MWLFGAFLNASILFAITQAHFFSSGLIQYSKHQLKISTTPERQVVYYVTMAQIDNLIQKVAAYVESYMGNFDGRHDFSHIKRVLGLSHTLYSSLLESNPETILYLNFIILAALLHDV